MYTILNSADKAQIEEECGDLSYKDLVLINKLYEIVSSHIGNKHIHLFESFSKKEQERIESSYIYRMLSKDFIFYNEFIFFNFDITDSIYDMFFKCKITGFELIEN